MKLLFIGDISARPGRHTVRDLLPGIRKEYNVDFVIANCENAAGGRGVTRKILEELQGDGIDFFTAGDHVWAFKDFVNELSDPDLPIVRPYNYERQSGLPGSGYKILELGNQKLVVVGMIGQGFMRFPGSNPFWAWEDLLEELEEQGIDDNTNIFIDFHAETTSETLSLGHFVADRATAFVGTHTHVPTADQRLIKERMAYVTDTGMVGPLDASLWVSFETTFHNFRYPYKIENQVEMEGRRVFNSVLIDLEDNKANSIIRVDRTVGHEK